jgi:hypothetical protein
MSEKPELNDEQKIMIELDRYEYAIQERDRYRSMAHRLGYALTLIEENIEDGMPKHAMLLCKAMLEDYKDFLLEGHYEQV